MNPEQYKKMVAKCDSREELTNLIKNTQDRKRTDLVGIAEKSLSERFPVQEKTRGAISRTKNSFKFDDVKDNYLLHPYLDEEQIIFLANHNIPQENLFNATGIRTASYQQKMRDLRVDIAYGTTRCAKNNHTLRTRAGHCIQCDPKKISFLIRHETSGEVYVAESIKGKKLIKVGCSISAVERIYVSNIEQYGGRSDWLLKYKTRVNKMGFIESSVHKELEMYAVSGLFYYKEGEKIQCREIFSCSFEAAINTLKQ